MFLRIEQEEFKRVLMARRLLSQSVLGGVFGRWIAFTEQCYVRLGPFFFCVTLLLAHSSSLHSLIFVGFMQEERQRVVSNMRILRFDNAVKSLGPATERQLFQAQGYKE